MGSSRRAFLKSAAASASLAALSPQSGSAFRFLAEDSLRIKLVTDPLRPQLHLLPAKNWMNDPNGPIFWNGLYHMFFQYNPNAAVWGDMHWNHAVSDDMIRWRHLPVALAPTPGWDDADGCFTGSAVNDNGVATILYTGVKKSSPERATLRDGHSNLREVQCLATSSDPQLRAWNKWKEPVIQPPEDPKLTGFRDPFLWQDGATWYLGVASGQFKQGGQVLLYRSKDLRNWEYLHPLASGHWTEKENINPVDSGEMWECPDFFALGNKHVLLYSTAGQVLWETGELDSKELVFHPQKRGLLDLGAYYAQKTQLDAHGNRILWGWISEKRPDAELIAAGWAGCMALPRVLSLASDGALEMRFAPQVESLRYRTIQRLRPHDSNADETSMLSQFEFNQIRGELTWRVTEWPFRLTLEDRAGVWWSVNCSASESGLKLSVGDLSADLPADPNAREFRLILDASVAELIFNKRHAFTTRIYRKPDGPLKLSVANSDVAKLESYKFWTLHPISGDRLTT
jgi:beta-fructofuranosidase